MMWTALLIALLLSLAALAYVVWPLLRPGPGAVMIEDDRLAELLGRKDSVMMAIKELEFDYHVGKLSEEDYQVYDARLRRQAVGLLQQLEQLSPQSAGVDDKVEAEIARRRRVAEPQLQAARQAVAAPVPAAMQAVPAAGPAAVLPVAGNGTGARFCTNCGSRIEATHKFCANCGTPVAGTV